MTIATGNGWTLHSGSCLDALTGLASLADDSIDVTLCDPPFEDEAHTKQRRVKRGGKCETESLPFVAITAEQRIRVASEMSRLTRRWILAFCQVEASQIWADAFRAAGLDYVRTMVWLKPDAMPQFTGDRPGMGYESIVVAHRPGRKRWSGGGRTGVFSENKNAGRPNGEPAPHPTTKPLPLMRELISLFSEPDELVLDPFAGSGSTGVACGQLGRRFIGWELDAAYHEIACRRLRGEAGRLSPNQIDMFATGAA